MEVRNSKVLSIVALSASLILSGCGKKTETTDDPNQELDAGTNNTQNTSTSDKPTQSQSAPATEEKIVAICNSADISFAQENADAANIMKTEVNQPIEDLINQSKQTSGDASFVQLEKNNVVAEALQTTRTNFWKCLVKSQSDLNIQDMKVIVKKTDSIVHELEGTFDFIQADELKDVAFKEIVDVVEKCQQKGISLVDVAQDKTFDEVVAELMVERQSVSLPSDVEEVVQDRSANVEDVETENQKRGKTEKGTVERLPSQDVPPQTSSSSEHEPVVPQTQEKNKQVSSAPGPASGMRGNTPTPPPAVPTPIPPKFGTEPKVSNSTEPVEKPKAKKRVSFGLGETPAPKFSLLQEIKRKVSKKTTIDAEKLEQEIERNNENCRLNRPVTGLLDMNLQEIKSSKLNSKEATAKRRKIIEQKMKKRDAEKKAKAEEAIRMSEIFQKASAKSESNANNFVDPRPFTNPFLKLESQNIGNKSDGKNEKKRQETKPKQKPEGTQKPTSMAEELLEKLKAIRQPEGQDSDSGDGW